MNSKEYKEITLIYKYSEKDDEIKIFGSDFVIKIFARFGKEFQKICLYILVFGPL